MNLSFTPEQLEQFRSQLEELIQQKMAETGSDQLRAQQLNPDMITLITSLTGAVPTIVGNVIVGTVGGAVGGLSTLVGGLISILNSVIGVLGTSALSSATDKLSPTLVNLIQKAVPTEQTGQTNQPNNLS
jgi:hypothetical protein